MHMMQIRVSTLGEGAQQVQRRRRLRVGTKHPFGIRHARFRGELDIVDDVAAVGRQLRAVTFFRRFGARFRELAREPPHLYDRTGGAESKYDRHLQQHSKRIANIVRMKLGEALGTVPTLEEKSAPASDLRERIHEIARFAGKYQRWISLQLILDAGAAGGIGIIRRLAHFPATPPVGRPGGRHDGLLTARVPAEVSPTASSLPGTGS